MPAIEFAEQTDSTVFRPAVNDTPLDTTESEDGARPRKDRRLDAISSGDGTRISDIERNPTVVSGARRLTGQTVRQFQITQQWEGIVTRVENGAFEAELHDLTDPTKPVEFAELELAIVSPMDRPLIRPGSVFYWIIGYETRQNGQILSIGELRMRRAPRLSARAKQSAKTKAEQLYMRFSENAQKQP